VKLPVHSLPNETRNLVELLVRDPESCKLLLAGAGKSGVDESVLALVDDTECLAFLCMLVAYMT
jgi:hypothetical protein